MFDVVGGLTLAGTLNVTDEPGFGPGVYRLFDYGGALTNNGLAIGALPGGDTGQIQTAVANEVNLVVFSGATQFWNGTTTSPTGTVVGGSGTWTAGTPTNWTNPAGSASTAWGGNFAVFQGAPGTVTVDEATGPVSTTGMQFIGAGWSVAGGPLTLAGADGQTTIRVGDGSAAGASYTATIASVVAGSGGLVKTDLGTLTLTGANTYAGGTTLSGGTLSVGSDANLGASAGGLTFDGGTLQVTGTTFTATGRTIVWGDNGGGFDIAAAGNTFTVSQPLGGAGGLTKLGAGALVLSGSNSYSGATTVEAGTLAAGADSAFSVNSAMIVDGTLDLGGIRQ